MGYTAKWYSNLKQAGHVRVAQQKTEFDVQIYMLRNRGSEELSELSGMSSVTKRHWGKL